MCRCLKNKEIHKNVYNFYAEGTKFVETVVKKISQTYFQQYDFFNNDLAACIYMNLCV